MKYHQVIFEKIKRVLCSHFGKEVIHNENGKHLAVGDSGIWISVDDIELTMGYGINHRHYHSKYDDIDEAIDQFFNLLTRKKRITEYYKGKYLYKIKAEIEGVNGEFTELGTSLTWLFPFWKRTYTEISILKKLIDFKLIENEITEIKNNPHNI